MQIHCLQCCNAEYKLQLTWVRVGVGVVGVSLTYLATAFSDCQNPCLPLEGVPIVLSVAMVTPTTLLSVLRCGTGLFGSRPADQVTALCFH